MIIFSSLFIYNIDFSKTLKNKQKINNCASELRAKEFSLKQAKLVKRKSVDPLNANEQDTRAEAGEIRSILTVEHAFGKTALLATSANVAV